MSKYNDFVENNRNDRRHFQEWIGDNIILNGVVNPITGLGIARIFTLNDEFELDMDSNDAVNSIVEKYVI